MNNNNFKRSQVFINKQFQLKFIIKALIPLLIIIMIMGVISQITLNSLEKEFHFESTNQLISTLSSKLGGSFQTSNAMFSSLKTWSILLLVFLLVLGSTYIIYIFLYFSHRIAGPILRFEHTLAEILKGNLKVKIHLRDKDEFKQTADQFNKMIEILHSRIVKIDDLNSHIIEKTENNKNLQETNNYAQEIKKTINEFDFR